MQSPRPPIGLCRATLTACAALITWANVASADPPAAIQNETGRGIALGSGMRALSISTAALAYNPSSLPFGRVYHMEGNVDYSPNSDSLMLGAAVVDSLTSSLAMGVSSRVLLPQSDGAPKGWDLRLGAGLPLTDAISVGVSGRYLNYTAPEALRGADNVDGEPGVADPSVDGVTLDAAIGIHPSEGIHLSLLGYNLINQHAAYAPVMAGGSLGFNVGEALTLGGDVIADFTTFGRATITAGGGIEYLHDAKIPLRLGYMFDGGRDLHYVSAGLGYNDQKMGVELGMQQGVSGTNDTRLIAALRYFVH